LPTNINESKFSVCGALILIFSEIANGDKRIIAKRFFTV
jgi:hypothetical protein